MSGIIFAVTSWDLIFQLLFSMSSVQFVHSYNFFLEEKYDVCKRFPKAFGSEEVFST
jgi:hypothetical protein